MKKVLDAGFQTTEQEVVAVLQSDLSKSKKMIQLFDLGFETKEISDIMSEAEGKLVRYNFVYNVISNHVNMNGIAVEASERSGKKEQILAMYLAGKSNKEISIELKTNYNYVFNTIKEFKLKSPEQAAAVEAAKQKGQAQ